MARTSARYLSFRLFNHNCVCTSHFPYSCYTSRPSHPPWCHQPNNVYLRAQISKLLIMHHSPLSCHLIPLTSKYELKLNYLDSFHIRYKKGKQSCHMPWKRLGERRYSSYSLTTSAPDGGERSSSRPTRTLPWGKGPPVPIVQEIG
jgi:hypothetical protein